MARRRALPTNLPESVVANPDELAECVEHVRAASCLALDTEFVGEDSYRPDLCLIQVATQDRLIVIDPFGTGPLDAFWELLLDPARVVVVHAGREEVRMCRFAIGRPPANVFDAQIAAGLVGFTYPIGYAGLVQEVLGARAHKGETLTDWRRRPLTPAQIKYAYDDVRYLLPIWAWLTDRLKRNDRLGWAAEEFAAFVRRAVNDDPAVEKWRKLKGMGGLNARELAVAREVFEWREAFAARLNRPPRVLLRDDLIVEIARRSPARAEDLHTLRGLPRGEADAILAAVRRAHALAPADCPEVTERDNDLPHVSTLASLLGVVLAEYCARIKIAPNLVATTQDLKALVRARQPGGRRPPESALAAGWRAAFIRPHLEAILDGREVIRVSDPASPTPISVHPFPAPDDSAPAAASRESAAEPDDRI
ncbi:ribonuclease D [Fimbriiglobus ruber]|uniref:Ribonuclease D n=1 Tax=Fimbriiglobus ruber TaxID=1908690 RepID=A0A225DF43_9BACT|nr:HRDC domain-containing protein [Fimbriiglobus ruber]OWK34717.1 Ribonuclease D [Fimbriiglobus ruber]